jgi:hypothetical protein
LATGTTAQKKPNINALVAFDGVDVADCNLRLRVLAENNFSVFVPLGSHC